MSYTPYLERAHPGGKGGIQRLYRFPNGYGASVIQSPFSYGNEKGLWELAVLRFDEVGGSRLDYSTEITSDVEGYLSEDEVQAIPSRIEALA